MKRHVGRTTERTCVSCGKKYPKDQLTRICRGLTGDAKVDPNKLHSGRGAYLCSKKDCWEKALSDGQLNRSLKTTISESDKSQIMNYYKSRLACFQDRRGLG